MECAVFRSHRALRSEVAYILHLTSKRLLATLGDLTREQLESQALTTVVQLQCNDGGADVVAPGPAEF